MPDHSHEADLERYQTYVRLTREGIWCFEMEQPIDLDRSPDQQMADLYQHAYLSECNHAFARMYGYDATDDMIGLRLNDLLAEGEKTNRQQLRRLVDSGYREIDLETIERDRSGRQIHILNTLTGVIEDNKLLRIWGTQRDIRRQKSVEAALRQRVESERLLADMAASLIHVQINRLDDALRDAMRRVGTFSDLDSVRITRISRDRREYSVTHEWCAEGIPPAMDQLQHLPMDSFSWATEHFVRLEPMHVPDVDALPNEARMEKELLKSMGVQSILSLPLVFGNSLEGIVDFSTTRGKKRWMDEEIVMMKLVTEVFAKAIQKNEADAALRDATQWFESVLDNIMQVAIQGFDRSGRILHWNRASETLYGYTRDEAMGKNIQDLLVPDDMQESFTLTAQDVWETGRAAEPSQWQAKRRDGSNVPILSLMFPMQTRGETVEVLSVDLDLSTHRDAEKIAQERERHLQTFFDESPDAIFVEDAEGIIRFVNLAACRLHGRTAEEMIGHSAFEFIPPEAHKKAKEDFSKWFADGISFNEGRSMHRDGRSMHRDGHSIPVEIRARSFAFAGKPAVILHVRDVSEKKQLDAESMKQHKLESLGLLAGGIAHDFNNILTAIMGNIELARMTTDDDDPRALMLDEAGKASLRARELSQQLLTFAKGGAPVKRRVRLNKVIEDAAAFALRGPSASYELRLAPDLEDVEGDPIQLSQVVQNLILNATEAMAGEGTVLIRSENRNLTAAPSTHLAPGLYACLTIEDRGAGIADDIKPRIFDPYFTTYSGRQGLGLATSLSIVHKHHGHIEIESQQGKGTTVTVYLPASESTLEAEIDQDPPTRVTGRILVMDDDESVRTIAVELLEQAGLEAEAVPDGQEAVQRYIHARDNGRPYTAVILDLSVPHGMGGRETIGQLTRIDPDVVAIVSSGYSSDPVMAHYREYGFRAVAGKPYQRAELLEAIREALKNA